MKPLIRLHRFWQDDNQTLDNCTVFDLGGCPIFTAIGLERGWRNNMSNVSCIPIGEYDVELEYSNKFGKNLWEIKGVPGRAECKFHSANHWFQLNGCVALGNKLADINNDNYRDVLNSGKTMRGFHDALDGFTRARLIITGERGIF